MMSETEHPACQQTLNSQGIAMEKVDLWMKENFHDFCFSILPNLTLPSPLTTPSE
jgi:hypothetical protein